MPINRVLSHFAKYTQPSKKKQLGKSDLQLTRIEPIALTPIIQHLYPDGVALSHNFDAMTDSGYLKLSQRQIVHKRITAKVS